MDLCYTWYRGHMCMLIYDFTIDFRLEQRSNSKFCIRLRNEEPWNASRRTILDARYVEIIKITPTSGPSSRVSVPMFPEFDTELDAISVDKISNANMHFITKTRAIQSCSMSMTVPCSISLLQEQYKHFWSHFIMIIWSLNMAVILNSSLCSCLNTQTYLVCSSEYQISLN